MIEDIKTWYSYSEVQELLQWEYYKSNVKCCISFVLGMIIGFILLS